MTECNTATVDFTPLGRRQVVADFLGGRLTSDGGALLWREVDRRIGLLDAIQEPPREITLDFDATDDRVHRHPEALARGEDYPSR